MNLFINTPEKTSTKNKKAMNTIYKLLLGFSVFMISSLGYSQNNADPGIGILMMPASIAQGDTGTLSATVGNYGNMTIIANSIKVTISVGTNAEILGIASSSDSRWTQSSLTTGSANSIILTNASGSFTSFDVGDILLNVRGNVVSGANLIFGKIEYIASSSQGDASIGNNNSQTSLIVTIPLIDAIADTFTAVNGTAQSVITNDTLNGILPILGTAAGDVKLTSTSTTELSINTTTGVITVTPNTPAGTYSISYTICEINNPTNCDTATASVTVTAPAIIAVADTPSVLPGAKTPSVITNDTVNGSTGLTIGTTPGNVTLTSTPNGPLTMNADGTISVAANTPTGTYPISYTICEVNNPTNCSTVTTTVTVTAPAILAVADTPSVLPGAKTPSVIINDMVNGFTGLTIGTAPGNITLTSTPALNSPLTMNSDGTISVAANTPASTYPISYAICEVNNPTNCSTVTTTVTVTAPAIVAVVDTPSVLPGAKTTSVIINDTVNGFTGLTIGTAPGNITLTSTPNGPLTMNADGTISVTVNTPAGTYPISYTICEVNNPTNCSMVTTTVTVTSPVIDAIADTLTAVNGTAPSVITNDSLNGILPIIGIAAGDVKLTSTATTELSINTTTGVITITPNTPVGTYSISYTICEINNPTNCDTATVSVTVPAPDFSPTIDIDDVVFSAVGVSKDFIVNISELGFGSSIGQVAFVIPKLSAFVITYSPSATSSNVSGGTDINNSDWIISENSLFIKATLKTSVLINKGSFSSVGFTISRKINIPSQTWQNITPTIVNGSGSDGVNSNNTYNVLVKAQ